MAFWTFIITSVTVLAICWGQTPCSGGKDCPKTMCCRGTEETQGYCHPLKSAGQDCQMYSGVPSWGQPAWKVRQCNCQDGLYCGSDDPSAGLGSRGTCRKWSMCQRLMGVPK